MTGFDLCTTIFCQLKKQEIGTDCLGLVLYIEEEEIKEKKFPPVAAGVPCEAHWRCF